MSMTKPMTAMGLMMLVDEGKASIDDPVEKHLPEFKGQMMVAATDRDAGTITLKKPSRPITIKDLLTHTAGQPEYPQQAFPNLMRHRDHTLADMALVSSQQPLEFEPGTKWKYSSAGIDVLGRLIEVFSGQSYEDFLAQRIFQPLAMQDTGFYLTRTQVERLAQLCAKRDGKLISAGSLPNTRAAVDPTIKPKFPSPAGGLYSTGADLAKVYQALLNGGQYRATRFIAEDTLTKMTQIQTGDLQASFSPGMSCGLGFHIVKKPQGVTGMLSPGTFGHGGLFGTQGWIDPVRDVFYVLLIQRTGLSSSDTSPMRREFQTLAAAAMEP
jgi:CubicO group peptidase (beta-lactamase class C family)